MAFLFQPSNYGPEVAEILRLDGDGERLMPLAMEHCASEAARERLRGVSAPKLFPRARAPEAALARISHRHLAKGRPSWHN